MPQGSVNDALLRHTPNGVSAAFGHAVGDLDVHDDAADPLWLICKLDRETDADIAATVTAGVTVPLDHHRDARTEGTGEQFHRGETGILASVTR